MSSVLAEYNRWKEFLMDLNKCNSRSVKPHGEEKRLLIECLQPVPWSENLLPQYNQQETKIGYLKKYVKSIRLDIDFLPNAILEEDVYHFMSPYKHIKEVSSSKR